MSTKKYNGNGNGQGKGYFINPYGKRVYPKQERPRKEYGTEKQRVELPVELVRCGKLVSPKAKLIYLDILSYNPTHPSFETLKDDCGYSYEALSNGIEELEIKKMITCISGQAERENNLYLTRPILEWDWFLMPVRPSDKRAHARERKRKGLKPKKRSFDNRNRDASIIETLTASIIEEESDQSQSDQLIRRDDAPRQRSPNGQHQSEENKGVPCGDDIEIDWSSIRETMPEAQFKNWIKPIKLIRCRDQLVALRVPSHFHEDWLRNHYMNQLTQTIHELFGPESELTFEVALN